MPGPISLPSDEENSKKNPRTWFNNLFNKQETTPLLGQEFTPKKKKNAFLAVTLTVISVLVVLFAFKHFSHRHKHHYKRPPPPSLTSAEKLMLNFPSNQSLHDYLKIYTSEAHLAGTPNDEKQALWTRDQFKSFGLDAHIDTYWPLLNYPISHRFAIVSGPEHLRYEAKLTEDVVDEDETSHNPNVIPTFHGYSKNGTVSGKVVYANYGRVEDFQFLKDQGIELNGTIALVRYGGSFRGLKVKAAEVFGCVGALIYSDPIDDGPLNKEQFPEPAKAYPEGPWRSKSSAQRGSVQFLSLLAGDPLTPGYAALENVTRIKPEDSIGLAKIPSLPLSWEDALPILKATQGHGVRAEQDWSGGLEEVDYFSGPTEGEAILINHIENKITPIWNVIARIEGTEEPDKAIILGNHRDAWVYGAVDPSSGSASLLELARTFGELLKTGWRPRRTIVLASWDAEEFGLVGSTEWVEDKKEWLNKEGAVYINVDVAVSGPHLEAQASPSLNHLIYTVTSEITDPNTGLSLYDAWLAEDGANADGKPTIGPLGSGSDFVGFMDHVGVACINLGFKGQYGVYHSNYDSFHWMSKFGDPQFLYHQTITKLWGVLAVRLADSPVLPIHPGDYATELSRYADTLTSYAAQSFPKLNEAVETLISATTKFEYKRSRLEHRLTEYESLDQAPNKLLKRLNRLNYRLTKFERGFIDQQGIVGREWFKHVVYAPGLWTGYSSQVFPNIADGIDAKNATWVQYAEERAALSILQAADWLKAHPE